MESDTVLNPATSTPYYKIKNDVESVADIYVNTIIEEMLPFQYDKIVTAIECTLIELEGQYAALLPTLKAEVLEQIILIKEIPTKLPHEKTTSKQALVQYLKEKLGAYQDKDSEIRKIIIAQVQEQQIEIIQGFIDNKKNAYRLELQSKIATNYDEKYDLIAYNETIATQEQQDARALRETYIQNNLTTELEKWQAIEQDNYLKAIEVYKNPSRALEIQRQHVAMERLALEAVTKSLVDSRKLLRIGKKRDSIEDYLLVKEKILTTEEAFLFNYEELNTYGYYYSLREKEIKDIFEFAIKLDSTKQVLNDLAKVDHEKIPYLFEFKDKLFKHEISFKDIAQYNNSDLNLIQSNADLLKIMAPIDVLNVSKAVLSNNIRGEIVIIEIIDKIKEHNKAGFFLIWAIRNDYKEVIKIIVEEAGEEISQKEQGIGLRGAVYEGHIEIVKYIIEELGQNITSEHKGSAFIGAAYRGHRQIVQYFLTTIGNEIPINDINQAINNAQAQNYNEIAEDIRAYKNIKVAEDPKHTSSFVERLQNRSRSPSQERGRSL